MNPILFATVAAGALIVLSIAGNAEAAPTPPALNPSTAVNLGVKVSSDICYTSDNDFYHSLDMYVPADASASRSKARPPLLVMIHGGGWGGGDKKEYGDIPYDFVRRGYIVASINYRLTTISGLPIPIYDCKSAIRWLRAHAGDYGFDPNRIVVAGHSAGGHLSEFLATTNGVKDFDQGENLSTSSDIQAAFTVAGVSDLKAWGFKGLALEKCDNVSPVHWISKKTVPMFIVHGDIDTTVPMDQSTELHAALDKAGIKSEIRIYPGEAHGGKSFWAPHTLDQVDTFFASVLKLDRHHHIGMQLAKEPYKIVNVSTPDIVVAAAGADVTFDTPSGADNQKWFFDNKGDGVYAIHPASDKSLSLTVQNGVSDNQTLVILVKDRNDPSQRWKVNQYGLSDMCFLQPECAPDSTLANVGGNEKPGWPVKIWEFRSNDWHLQCRVSKW